MKKYIYLLIMACFAIQLQSCSNTDDDSASSNEPQQDSQSNYKSLPGLPTRGEILDGINSGEIYGGKDTDPVEGKTFYQESTSDVVMVTALGSFSTIDQDGKVEYYNNLGGAVQTKEGGSFTMTAKGKGLHIEGSGTSHPQEGFTSFTKVSLDIDDKDLLKTSEATIKNFNMSTVADVTMYGSSLIINTHLAATDIPMKEDATIFTYWKGGTITDYTYSTEGLSMSLYDNPANFIEVWITFKDGVIASTRIGLK